MSIELHVNDTIYEGQYSYFHVPCLKLEKSSGYKYPALPHSPDIRAGQTSLYGQDYTEGFSSFSFHRGVFKKKKNYLFVLSGISKSSGHFKNEDKN